MDNMNLLSHSQNIDVVWRTRKFGSIEFDANYKFWLMFELKNI